MAEETAPQRTEGSERCWCGGIVVDGVCSKADPNEVGP